MARKLTAREAMCIEAFMMKQLRDKDTKVTKVKKDNEGKLKGFTLETEVPIKEFITDELLDKHFQSGK